MTATITAAHDDVVLLTDVFAPAGAWRFEVGDRVDHQNGRMPATVTGRVATSAGRQLYGVRRDFGELIDIVILGDVLVPLIEPAERESELVCNPRALRNLRVLEDDVARMQDIAAA
jgi:hypothetical protein